MNESDSFPKKTTFDVKRNISQEIDNFFALYTYHANRLGKRGSTDVGTKSSHTESTVADLLTKEAKANSDFSLSVVTTNIAVESETELRQFIAKKLGKGTVFSGTGNVAKLNFIITEATETPLDCYFCLLRQLPDDLEQLVGDADVFNGDDEKDSYYSQEYVVCFISKANGGLDLFRPDLDRYCEGLLPLLDSHRLYDVIQEDLMKLKEVSKRVTDYLARWHDDALQYICRCVARIGESLQYLIYVALSDTQMQIQGADENFASDLKKFQECCSLSELMAASSSDTKSSQSDLESLSADMSKILSSNPIPDVILEVRENKCTFNKTDCTKFCSEFAQSLLNCEQSAVLLRQRVESYKLKVIQDMNSLKRLIQQAENDHYALYRAYIFLNENGNGAILLQHAKLEYQTDNTQDACKVLLVLEEYINETGGLNVVAVSVT